jgi:hypothetical protein
LSAATRQSVVMSVAINKAIWRTFMMIQTEITRHA